MGAAHLLLVALWWVVHHTLGGDGAPELDWGFRLAVLSGALLAGMALQRGGLGVLWVVGAWVVGSFPLFSPLLVCHSFLHGLLRAGARRGPDDPWHAVFSRLRDSWLAFGAYAAAATLVYGYYLIGGLERVRGPGWQVFFMDPLRLMRDGASPFLKVGFLVLMVPYGFLLVRTLLWWRRAGS